VALGRKTGGRKKGVPNKATAAKLAAIEASGLTPLDYMLSVMRDPANEPEIRLAAAKDAAPYVHARLASVELSGKVDVRRADEYTDAELAAIIAAGRPGDAGSSEREA
jgi:hypothetical protein